MIENDKMMSRLTPQRIITIRMRIRNGFYFTKEVKEIIVRKVINEFLLKGQKS